MKKNVLILGALMFVGSSVFGQDVKQIPNFTSEAEKAAWIQAHPTDYERLSGEKVTNAVPEFKTQAEKDAWVKAQEPVKTNLVISSEAEKEAWLLEHPNVTYVTQEEFNALPAEKQAVMLSDANYVILK
jgi:hypothetical protein